MLGRGGGGGWDVPGEESAGGGEGGGGPGRGVGCVSGEERIGVFFALT